GSRALRTPEEDFAVLGACRHGVVGIVLHVEDFTGTRELLELLAGIQVPEPERVVAAAGDGVPSVAVHRHAVDLVRVAVKRTGRSGAACTGHLPDLQRGIATRCEHPRSVPAEANAVYVTAVPAHPADKPPCLHIEEVNLALAGARHQVFVVRAKDDVLGTLLVVRAGEDFAARGQVPHLDGAIVTAGGAGPAVGTNGHMTDVAP